MTQEPGATGGAALEVLIAALRRLPGVGQKSTQRMAFHLLQHDRAAAQHDQRLLRGVELGNRRRNLPGIGRGPLRQRARCPAFTCGLLQEVERHFDVDGPRPLAGEMREGGGHCIAHVLGRIAAEVEAGHRGRRAALVDHLMQAPAPLRGIADVERGGNDENVARVIRLDQLSFD